MASKYKYITVRIDDEVEEMLNERIKYLQKIMGPVRVTKSDAVRHALMKSGYTRKKGNISDLNIDD